MPFPCKSWTCRFEKRSCLKYEIEFKAQECMLRNSLLNEKLNQRLLSKETSHFLNKFMRYFFSETKNLSLKKTIFLRQFYVYLLYGNQKILFKSPFAKVRTVCFLTGRNRSVYRSFHLSRIKLREFAALGSFSGLSKASW